MAVNPFIIDLAQVNMRNLEEVGGKNASLGEMISHLSASDVQVPGGFATTVSAFKAFLSENALDKIIYEKLSKLDADDIKQLTIVGKEIRTYVANASFSTEFENNIRIAYKKMLDTAGHEISVAVRSSATAEDLPDASFAGQQESFLNVKGIDAVLQAIKEVFASLYNDRAIAYRVHHGFNHEDVAISAGIQMMVRSDLAASGVMFTIDTESGFDKVVFITSSYGLGEMIVQGAVNPDEFYVFKPALAEGKPAVIRKCLGSKLQKMVYSNNLNNRVTVEDVNLAERQIFSLNQHEIELLAKQAVIIEKHYGRPMDIEWAKDGIDGKIYILQARPETVKSQSKTQCVERYTLKSRGTVLAEGRSIGQRIGQGTAKIIHDIGEMHKIQPGDVLISDMTDPDWEPIMKKASAIVTNRGGRTCHAAIIARELGIPAVVGCGDATQVITDGSKVTVSCAEGDTGFVYDDLLTFEHDLLDIESMPELPVKIMLNVGNPERAFSFQSVPNSGVGLARLEFLISNTIGIHPNALLDFDSLQDATLKQKICEKIAAYESPVEYYIERLKEGIATIAATFYPQPVIVRLSDFKSNEYANLIGGHLYEPDEENPMLGFRGASRYVSSNFTEAFALECKAVRRVREEMGLDNVEIMIPFVRSVNEAKDVIEALRQQGLERGKDNLRIIMMCEIPANALLADQFLEYFDGFSIGSNDLTQLTLGLDRDSGLVAAQFDERNDAVKALLHMAIKACKKANKYIGICGQGPSDHPDFAEWLLQEGIDSLSLNPDSVLNVCLFLDKNQMNAHKDSIASDKTSAVV